MLKVVLICSEHTEKLDFCCLDLSLIIVNVGGTYPGLTECNNVWSS